MKNNKITAALLSAVLTLSPMAAPVTLLAASPAESVQEAIDALPTRSELEAMNLEEQSEIYFQVQEAYDLYQALSEEEKNTLTNTGLFEDLFSFFNSQIMPLDPDTDESPVLTPDIVEEEDGSTTTTIEDENGVISIVKKDAEGTIFDVSIIVPDSMENQKIVVPMEAYPAGETDPEKAPLLHLSSAQRNLLLIPIEDSTIGTVLGVWLEDGSYHVDSEAVVQAGYIYVPIQDEHDTFIFDNTKTFSDADEESSAYAAIEFISARDLLNAQNDDQFYPNEPVSRGMLARVIWNMYHDPAVVVSNDFEIPSDAYYYDAVQFVYQNGFMTGYNEENFGADQNLTREQLVTVLWRMMGEPVVNYLLEAPDSDEVSEYALEAVRWAVSTGILQGLEDGRLNPNGDLQRYQLALIMQRFITFGVTGTI